MPGSEFQLIDLLGQVKKQLTKNHFDTKRFIFKALRYVIQNESIVFFPTSEESWKRFEFSSAFFHSEMERCDIFRFSQAFFSQQNIKMACKALFKSKTVNFRNFDVLYGRLLEGVNYLSQTLFVRLLEL